MKMESGVVVCTCNPCIQEAKAGGSWFWGQPGWHSETLFQKKTQNQKTQPKVIKINSQKDQEETAKY
jgi:hypothetical protein